MIRDVDSGADVQRDSRLPWNINDDHPAGVGTASYAAPEQISQKHYGPSADIFSLGLILLELFSNFTSEHERAKAFHDCRHHGEIASWMKRTYPEVSTLVLACTQSDWKRRPSASDIQAAGVFQERGSGIEIFRAELSALKVEMSMKENVIQRQREELKAKDEMIESLKRRLEKVEAGSGVDTMIDAGVVKNVFHGDPIDSDDSIGSSNDDDY